MTETTRTVKVTDFVLENPPALLVSETVTGPSGRSRLFTQKIQVADADLWRRLTSEVKRGDTISVTVKTIWPNSGPYYTVLDGYALLDAASAAPALTAFAA